MKNKQGHDIFGWEENTPNINTMNAALGMRESSLHKVWFKPDNEFIDWLIEYANERLIFDIGAGSMHFTNLINAKYKRVMAIEPQFDYTTYLQLCQQHNRERIHVHPDFVENTGHIISGVGEKGMLVCARPAHSGMVVKAIETMDESQELLYITIPENLRIHNDLGEYRKYATKIHHRGRGSELEEVWSVKLK